MELAAGGFCGSRDHERCALCRSGAIARIWLYVKPPFCVIGRDSEGGGEREVQSQAGGESCPCCVCP